MLQFLRRPTASLFAVSVSTYVFLSQSSVPTARAITVFPHEKVFPVTRAQAKLASGHTLRVRKGNMIDETTEVIVNAANNHLMHGGGLAKAIATAGGAAINKESSLWVKQKGEVPTGDLAVTSGGQLPFRYIFHAVGPVWDGGNNDAPQLLHSAVRKSLEKANEVSVYSIAIPAISSGIFGYPKDLCAKEILDATVKWCKENVGKKPKEIHFTNIDEETVVIFENELKSRYPKDEVEEKDEL